MTSLSAAGASNSMDITISQVRGFVSSGASASKLDTLSLLLAIGCRA
ncbi:hypothetical protein G3I67_04055 [Orrella sp. NBD-18]|uniref:Uncharacterized protein n=1 Tax=Sheuella amnicola TaxID=2707330 RepID=A0A6B2QW83_9BURK|nr:hypothetical protein [Sheuella amnicola]NDY82401.1 hypothetical protein [Sheuella amnicola]